MDDAVLAFGLGYLVMMGWACVFAAHLAFGSARPTTLIAQMEEVVRRAKAVRAAVDDLARPCMNWLERRLRGFAAGEETDADRRRDRDHGTL